MTMLSVMGLYQYDQTLFDTLQLPEELDKETLIGNILLECAELETFISDPEVMKEAIGYWSKKNLDNWQRIYETLTAEYNPLWNKDGTYSETETRNLASSGTSTGSVSAFNTTGFQNQSKQDAKGTDTGTIKRERRESGNIGLTTSQSMVREESDLRRELNIYDFITEDFKSRFCLLVY